MSLQRLLYRGRQFWLALRLCPSTRALEKVQLILGPDLYVLFLRMQLGEQSHSFRMVEKLLAQGENHPDLLMAALLHDVGKTLHKLQLWERVWIVLAHTIFGERSHRWGAAPREQLAHLPFWQQSLVVAEQHPAWGADMVAAAGGTPLAVQLIRCHADRSIPDRQSLEGRLLALLQFVDDNS